MNSKMTCFSKKKKSVFATSVCASKVPSLKYICDDLENINQVQTEKRVDVLQ